MTRTGGQRALRIEGGRSQLLVLLCFLLLPAPGRTITIGGRFGLEVDGVGEEYLSLGVFDDRIDIGEGIEDQLEESPVRSREATTLALLELRLNGGERSRAFFHFMETGRVATTRQRSSMLTELGFRTERNRFLLENQWDLQEGKDEPTPGSQDFLTLTWDRDSLPAGLRSQIRFGANWSQAAEETLASIFDYRTLRGQFQLRRDVTSRLEIRGLVGFRDKTALSSSTGSYDSWFAETEAYGSLRYDDRLEATLRLEDRTYEADTSGVGIPSSRAISAEGRYERGAGRGWRPFTNHRLEWQDYESSSDVFQDHFTWTGQVGTDLYWNRLRGAGDDIELLLRPDLRLRLGAEVELFRAVRTAEDSLSFTSTYDSFGGILGIAREGTGSFWIDLSFEAGRREYRADGEMTNLTFEGLNFTFSTTDYTYLRTTLLAEWSPVPWLRAEGFIQWDEELHDSDSDNFRLWILNATLTYPF